MLHRKYLPLIVFGLLSIVWGSTWLFIKIGLENFAPFRFAGVRFLIAGGVLVGYTLLRRIKYPVDKISWRIMLLLSLVQISIPYALVFWGEQYISSGLAAILIATVPFFVVFSAHFLVPGERITFFKIAGLLTSFVGVIFIFFGDIVKVEESFWGSMAMVIASASAGFANVYAKRNSVSLNPYVNVAVQLSLGGILLSTVSILIEPDALWSPDTKSITALLYLSILGSSIAFVALYWLIGKMDVTKVSLLTFITPVVAVFCGAIFLGESFEWNVLSGAFLILLGVYLVNKRRPFGETAN